MAGDAGNGRCAALRSDDAQGPIAPSTIVVGFGAASERSTAAIEPSDLQGRFCSDRENGSGCSGQYRIKWGRRICLASGHARQSQPLPLVCALYRLCHSGNLSALSLLSNYKVMSGLAQDDQDQKGCKKDREV